MPCGRPVISANLADPHWGFGASQNLEEPEGPVHGLHTLWRPRLPPRVVDDATPSPAAVVVDGQRALVR